MSKTLKTIFFTTAKVVNMAIRCKKSANILIYFKDKINESNYSAPHGMSSYPTVAQQQV